MAVLYSYNFEHMYATIKYAQDINRGSPYNRSLQILTLLTFPTEQHVSIIYKGGGAEFCPTRKGRDAFQRRAAYGHWRCSLSIFFPTIYKSTKYPVPRILASSLSIFTQLHSLRVEIYFIPNNLPSEKKRHAIHILHFQHILKIPSSSGKERTQAAVE